VNTFVSLASISNRANHESKMSLRDSPGPAIKPIVSAWSGKPLKLSRFPVIGLGGITTPEDAVEFLLAGATAIQVGTASSPIPAL